ncbi:Pachytene checkpoint protein 2-like [Holothuria leucospilota]|uniref:Pachytene checkpoint protein 2 homolog n=1 Tax=Holothuria leucospilota TaxID=206669 RepID=A0A9Q1HE44_HOLLE|nr:Pachytene checkpoint protein 2-like [Holothuria leucospilota]
MNGVGELVDALPPPVTESSGMSGLKNCSVHVEVCQSTYSTVTASEIQDHVREMLYKIKTLYGDVSITEFEDPFLTEHVQYVAMTDTELSSGRKQAIDLCSTQLWIHVFTLSEDGPACEELDGEEMSAANHWLLPAADMQGLWDNLIFDGPIKSNLLHYAMTTLLFSDRKVDPSVISWNRVVLLHGPPGTGKTSLCKALAQKLTIRLSGRYSYGQFIEINSHSLFSKWFSESGKLVMKMFQKIQELIDDPDAIVFVLIDEVESLTAARQSAMSGSDPSDAIRVVNALLTQIDQIKKNSNVLILTTSNVTGAIDLAFVDRADIKQYIGPPSAAAIFKIYHSCINELMKTGIISPPQQILDLRALEVVRFMENDATKHSLKLREVAQKSYSLSGRTLRKLPFLAHALFIQKPTVTLEVFLEALERAVQQQFEERRGLDSKQPPTLYKENGTAD